jgi:hypothetical protein
VIDDNDHVLAAGREALARERDPGRASRLAAELHGVLRRAADPAGEVATTLDGTAERCGWRDDLVVEALHALVADGTLKYLSIEPRSRRVVARLREAPTPARKRTGRRDGRVE